MKLSVLAVGSLKDKALKTVADDYIKRCHLWRLSIQEVSPQPPGKASNARKELEGKALLKLAPTQAPIIALDEHGKNMSSRELSSWLSDYKDQGVTQISFLIGGADGLSKGILSRADRKIALGRLTWPHQLARVMLLEQLYRAQLIASGHPYHRD